MRSALFVALILVCAVLPPTVIDAANREGGTVWPALSETNDQQSDLMLAGMTKVTTRSVSSTSSSGSLFSARNVEAVQKSGGSLPSTPSLAMHEPDADDDVYEPTPIYVYSLTEAAIPVPDLSVDFLTWSAPVVVCESSGIADNINKASGARGLLQLMTVHQKRAAVLGLSWDDMLTPIPNLTVAESIWKEQGESPWIESASCVRRLLND